MSIKVSVVGASGRMGKLALDLIEGAQDLELHSALDSKSELSATAGADVIFDVTRLEVSENVVRHALEQGVADLHAALSGRAAPIAVQRAVADVQVPSPDLRPDDSTGKA